MLERFNVRFVHFLGEPAPQCVQRPDIADARLALEQSVDVGDGVQRIRVIKGCAFRELDIDVEGICAGQLDVEAVAGLHRPLPVRHLVRQPVTRLQLGIAHREHDNDKKAQQRVKARPCDHADRDPAAQPAQPVERRVHVPDRCDECGLVADEQDAKQRHAHETATSATTTAIRPASPNVRIRSEDENCSAMNDTPAVAWVSTQAGPTISKALRNAVNLSSPRAGGRGRQR